MSVKMAILGYLKIKVFWNKGFNVIISFHDVANNFLLRHSNYIRDVVMWPKSANSSVSMRGVIITSLFLGIWTEKPLFWGVVLIQSQ